MNRESVKTKDRLETFWTNKKNQRSTSHTARDKDGGIVQEQANLPNKEPDPTLQRNKRRGHPFDY